MEPFEDSCGLLCMKESMIKSMYETMQPYLNEQTSRLFVATLARTIGWGGITAVSNATGISRTTIGAGLEDLDSSADSGAKSAVGDRIRKPGGVRKKVEENNPEICAALDRLIEPSTRGAPNSALRWCSKSTRHLAEELCRLGFPVSASVVGRLLHEMGYSLQGLSKVRAGQNHPDRNRQFENINQLALQFIAEEEPVISVDTKKKELVGSFDVGGVEWQPIGKPECVNDHDFASLAGGKAIPYGVYDVHKNEGLVNVGVDHDTPEFAVESIRTWWRRMGIVAYPNATKLLITADCGGSNGYRVHTWKTNLQRFANETGLHISVCHLPPGTSKWNKIEHRMFSHISMNWRERPLESFETVVNLIGSTTTRKGLRIEACLDERHYDTGAKASADEIKGLSIDTSQFHPEWNYTLHPHTN